MKGYVQVYTGNGKGKTTAALGLIVRACGAGLKVYLCQFFKRGLTGEIRTLRKRFPDVTVVQCGRGCFIRGKPAPADRRFARRGLAGLRAAMLSGQYDLLVADEACTAAAVGLIPVKALLDLVRDKPDSVELVLTGRHAGKALIRAADLVTEMKDIKHYFKRGVQARPGIER